LPIELEEKTNISPKDDLAVLRKDEDFTLKKSLVISTILHPGVFLVAWLTMVLLAFFGIKINLFDRPEPKVKDIEFVLVDKPDKPINKNTPYRSDVDSRAGGKHDPTKRVSMPSAPAAPKQEQKAAPKQPAKQPAKVQTPTPAPKAAPAAKAPQPAPKAPAAQAPTPAAPTPAPPAPKPSVKPSTTPPKVVSVPTSNFQVPVPKPGTGSYSSGPVGSSSSSKGTGTGSGGSGTTAGPVLAPTGGGSGSKMGTSGGGSGAAGNPGPGNPNGRPGIDTIKEPDFGPYMRDLQRRIKMNWEPPKGNESKRVVLLFKIAKDGRLLSCTVYKSSGLPNADKAAINAVQLSAPFKPLPADFKGASIDIQFTFDYNVFGAAGYQ
jgi:TonB family protein